MTFLEPEDARECIERKYTGCIVGSRPAWGRVVEVRIVIFFKLDLVKSVVDW